MGEIFQLNLLLRIILLTILGRSKVLRVVYITVTKLLS